MAASDPMKDRMPVQLEISRQDCKFLKEILAIARDGIREELSEHGRQLREPRRLRREVEAYDRLLRALAERRVAADPELRAVMAQLAKVIDEGNEHSRVVAEHEAMHRLLASLERRPDCDSTRSGRLTAIRCAGLSSTSRR